MIHKSVEIFLMSYFSKRATIIISFVWFLEKQKQENRDQVCPKFRTCKNVFNLALILMIKKIQKRCCNIASASNVLPDQPIRDCLEDHPGKFWGGISSHRTPHPPWKKLSKSETITAKTPVFVKWKVAEVVNQIPTEVFHIVSLFLLTFFQIFYYFMKIMFSFLLDLHRHRLNA